jgi:GNAT superfamily N-acetyltransferase
VPTRQALCLLCTEGLSDESRTNFHDLMSNGHRDAADTQKCHEIAAAGAPSQSVCTDAKDEGLEACHDDAAQEGGVRFDLVLLPQGDRTAILGWAFFTVGGGGNVYEVTVGIAIADALKGFGKKMMHALIAAARTATMVTALASYVRAVALYERLGFERLSTWRHDHHPFLTVNDTLVRMRLSLEPRR